MYLQTGRAGHVISKVFCNVALIRMQVREVFDTSSLITPGVILGYVCSHFVYEKEHKP